VLTVSAAAKTHIAVDILVTQLVV